MIKVSEIIIERATQTQAVALSDLSRLTFIETFAKDNSEENISRYVSETFSPQKQLHEICDPNRFIEIAWIDKRPAGFFHLLTNSTEPSIKSAKPIEILRLYVDSRWHGKGVGAALMTKVISFSRDAGFETLWLGVWEKNFRAQAFYKKYGFATVGEHIFRLGSDEQTDLIMALTLK